MVGEHLALLHASRGRTLILHRPLRGPMARKAGGPATRAPTPPSPEPVPSWESLGIPAQTAQHLRQGGMAAPFPPQAAAIPHALSGHNLVLAVPTASGKSLVAYLAALRTIAAGGKVLYIVPLRALAAEKVEDLQALAPLGVRAAASVGDFDTPDLRLGGHNVVVATSEKADSLLRHRSPWLEEVQLVVADECHLIDDAGRGPTLEVTIARFRQHWPTVQLLALSATINNSAELAAWLDAAHVTSEWRPTLLRTAVHVDSNLYYTDGEERGPLPEVNDLLGDVLREGGQGLVFVGTRRSAEKVAKDAMRVVGATLDEPSRAELRGAAGRLRSGTPTEVGEVLARCIEEGAAFHHAGLTNAQRSAVERLFKQRRLKALSATPTLAAGINLPARRVIIRDTKRYDSLEGRNSYLSVMEVKQMLGRAGRPGYDPVGEGIVMAKGRWESERFIEEYFLGPPEDITSKLGNPAALRGHLLASVAAGFCSSQDQLVEFLGHTFYAHTRDLWVLKDLVDEVVQFLQEEELIAAVGDELEATAFGKRVSDLYLDPISGVLLRDGLLSPQPIDALGYLYLVCSTPELKRFGSALRQSETDWVADAWVKAAEHLPLPLGTTQPSEEMLSAFKTALLLREWASEAPEQQLCEVFGMGPGDLRNRVETAQWVVFGAKELARLFSATRVGPLWKLLDRVRYGVREELLDLVRLRGIGRVRARHLWSAGYKDRAAIAEAGEALIARVPGIGTSLASTIVSQAKARGAVPRAPAAPGTVIAAGAEPVQGDGTFEVVEEDSLDAR